MRTLLQRISERLLVSGTEMAFDHRQIAQGIARGGHRAGGPYDDAIAAQALFLVNLLSRLKIRLGLFLMPPPP